MKGQISIESIFGYMLVALAVVAALILIMFPGIGQKAKAEQILTGEGIDKQNLAELELISYLRTPLPDDLPEKIEAIQDKTNLAFNIDKKIASQTLRDNSWTYKGKTYSEFLTNMYDIETSKQYFFVSDDYTKYFDGLTETEVYKQKRQHTIAAVTRVMFNKEGKDKFNYEYPKITISYLYKNQHDPEVFQYIPITGGRLAKVGLIK